MPDPNNEYQYTWLTEEMFQQGWYELRNGIVYHRDWSPSDVVRRDDHGNYLVRRKRA